MNMRDLPDWSENRLCMRMVSQAIIDAKDAVKLSDEAKMHSSLRCLRNVGVWTTTLRQSQAQDSCHTFSCWHTNMFTHCTRRRMMSNVSTLSKFDVSAQVEKGYSIISHGHGLGLTSRRSILLLRSRSISSVTIRTTCLYA